MQKILIIGGSNFFGIDLVNSLTSKNTNISVLNRGNKDITYAGQVEHIICDRESESKMQELFKDRSFDIIFDQICLNKKHAEIACRVFNGKCQKYIQTSSQSVYNEGSNIKEQRFNPLAPPVDEEFNDYALGKQEAEIEFARNATFPITYVRFPIVMGETDSTKRLFFHVNRIKNGLEIAHPNLDASMTCISNHEAVKALTYLSTHKFTGAINIASGLLNIGHLFQLIEHKTNKSLKWTKDRTQENGSPYGIPSDWWMNTDLMKRIGLELKGPDFWLGPLIDFYLKNEVPIYSEKNCR